MHLKISSVKRRPFCPGGDELKQNFGLFILRFGWSPITSSHIRYLTSRLTGNEKIYLVYMYQQQWCLAAGRLAQLVLNTMQYLSFLRQHLYIFYQVLTCHTKCAQKNSKLKWPPEIKSWIMFNTSSVFVKIECVLKFGTQIGYDRLHYRNQCVW